MERLYKTAEKMYECIDRCDIMGLEAIVKTNGTAFDSVKGSIGYLACYLFNKYIEDNPEVVENPEIIRMQKDRHALRKFRNEACTSFNCFPRYVRLPFNCDENFFAVRYYAGKLLHLIFQGDKNAYVLFEALIFMDTVKCDRSERSELKEIDYLKEETKNYLCDVINSAIKYENTGILNRIIDYFGKSLQNDGSDEYSETKTRAAFCFQLLNKCLLVNDIIELRDNYGLDFFSSDREAVIDAFVKTAAEKYNSFRFYKQFNIKYNRTTEERSEEIAKELLNTQIEMGYI